MRRREFITLLGGAAAWPLAARAQQPNKPVIGFLSSQSQQSVDLRLAPFKQGLREAGFVEGENVAFEFRWGENQYNRLPALAADLVGHNVTLLVSAGGTPGALAAKAATTTIPILFVNGADPVKLGLVASLNRPGGNITGVNLLANMLGSKQLELLHGLVPRPAVIGFLVNPTTNLAEPDTEAMQAAATALQRKLLIVYARTENEIDKAFSTLIEQEAKALVVEGDPFFNNQTQQIVALAAKHGLPAMYQFKAFVEAGGLMSYGSSISDSFRQAGLYAGRILKGERPADLPVQQTTKFDLVINLKTAKALSVTIPPTLYALADELVE
jgi:putative ABC transport system substrate-binding protein